MQDDLLETGLPDEQIQAIRSNLEKAESPKWRRITEKFVLAVLGAIPWVGGIIAAAASIRSEEAAVRSDGLQTKWLEEHELRLIDLRDTLHGIDARFESLGPEIENRIQSKEYLALVRQAFRAWDQAGTEDKRRYVANLVTNCAGTRVCSDDVVRLFITWIDLFHEAHFAVIREIHQNPGSTRFDIWSGVYGDAELPREDSAEADLYRMLIRDLSIDGVIRQARDVDGLGRFVRRRAPKRRGPTPTVIKSAFDDEEKYVLTELGRQFVHYTMNETIGRLTGS